MDEYTETHKPGKIFLIKYRDNADAKTVTSHRMMFCDYETEEDALAEWQRRRPNAVDISVSLYHDQENP